MGVVIATSKQHGNGDVKFTLILSTAILRRCTNFASTTSVNYLWSHSQISTALRRGHKHD